MYQVINVGGQHYLAINLSKVHVYQWETGDAGAFIRLRTMNPVDSDEMDLTIEEPNPVSNIVPTLLEVML